MPRSTAHYFSTRGGKFNARSGRITRDAGSVGGFPGYSAYIILEEEEEEE